jgi:hypothetical protein
MSGAAGHEERAVGRLSPPELLDSADSAEAERLIVAVLAGDRRPWPASRSEALERACLRLSTYHGVDGLLVERRALLAEAGWPSSITEALVERARRQVVLDLVMTEDLRRVLDAMAEQRIDVLLLKGAPLAYTHYPSPHLRPRTDTDLLIQPSDRDRVAAVMQRLGYRTTVRPSGQYVTHQVTYARLDDHGVALCYDVHWRVADPAVFADLFAFRELSERGVRVKALGEHARALDPVDALLLACVHRVAHHAGEDRLLWIYDIHLLASRLDASSWAQFSRLAVRKRIASVCQQGLELAASTFRTPLPGSLGEALSRGEAAEPAADFLRASGRKVDILASDLRTLPGWRPRVRLIREHLFPPVAYMKAAYGRSWPPLVPFLYMYRILRGAPRWFRR